LERDSLDNGGLPGPDHFLNVLNSLDLIYDRGGKRLKGLSRADFYVLAGEAALENALEEGCEDRVCQRQVNTNYYLIQ